MLFKVKILKDTELAKSGDIINCGRPSAEALVNHDYGEFTGEVSYDGGLTWVIEKIKSTVYRILLVKNMNESEKKGDIIKCSKASAESIVKGGWGEFTGEVSHDGGSTWVKSGSETSLPENLSKKEKRPFVQKAANQVKVRYLKDYQGHKKDDIVAVSLIDSKRGATAELLLQQIVALTGEISSDCGQTWVDTQKTAEIKEVVRSLKNPELSKPIGETSIMRPENRFPNRFPDQEPISEKETVSALKNDPKAIIVISEILQKRHKGDMKPLTLLMIHHIGGLLGPKYRAGGKISGPTAAGKDNAIKTVHDNLPDYLYMATTQTSDKYFQRKLGNLPPNIYFKELNMRQKGANINNIELLKALQEDGFTYGFCDKDENGKVVTVENKSERINCLWSTTELGGDDELLNRVINYSFRGGSAQTKAVIEKMAAEVGSAEDLAKSDNNLSLIKDFVESLTIFDGVIIPYLKDITSFIDINKESARRYFRLLRNCISWVAFFHQKQREIQKVTKDDIDRSYIVAEPIDLYIALVLLGEGLRNSYTGNDPRIDNAIKVIRSMEEMGGWLPMGMVKRSMNLNKKISWQLFDELENLNLIETRSNPEDKRKRDIRLTAIEMGSFLNKSISELLAIIHCNDTALVQEMIDYFDGNLSKPIETYLETYFSECKKAYTDPKTVLENKIGSLVPEERGGN